MGLKGVTICGADDGVILSSLAGMSERFPFVEWGILVGSHPGAQRYPTMVWLHELCVYNELRVRESRMRLSLHVCGKWLRDIATGEFTFANAHPSFMGSFSRVQLNFRSAGGASAVEVWRALMPFKWRHEFIFQMDGDNDHLYETLWPQINASPLYDRSGGRGVSPAEWPKPGFRDPGLHCGYAGGLNSNNIVSQLSKIAEAAGESEFWIDVESGVRNENGEFDFDAVEVILRYCEPFIAK